MLEENTMIKEIDQETYKHGFTKVGDISILTCNDSFDESEDRIEKDIVQFEDVKSIILSKIKIIQNRRDAYQRQLEIEEQDLLTEFNDDCKRSLIRTISNLMLKLKELDFVLETLGEKKICD